MRDFPRRLVDGHPVGKVTPRSTMPIVMLMIVRSNHTTVVVFVISFAIGISNVVVVTGVADVAVAGAVEAEFGMGNGFGVFVEDGPVLLLGGVEMCLCQVKDCSLWFVSGNIKVVDIVMGAVKMSSI